MNFSIVYKKVNFNLKMQVFYKVEGAINTEKGEKKDQKTHFFREFHAQNPIEARQAAFAYYFDQLFTLLAQKNESYVSHIQAQKVVQELLSPEFHPLDTQTDHHKAIGRGIYVSVVYDNKVLAHDPYGHPIYEKEEVIHFIDIGQAQWEFLLGNSPLSYHQIVFENLLNECAYYVEKNQPLDQIETYHGLETEQTYKVIRTPIRFESILELNLV